MDRWFRARVGHWARTEPEAFVAGLARKTGRFLSAREVPRDLDVDRHATLSPVLSALTWHRGVLQTSETSVVSSLLASSAALTLTFEWE